MRGVGARIPHLFASEQTPVPPAASLRVLTPESNTMNTRYFLAATLTALTLAATTGCAVTRGQESVGAYVDDTAITTAVKARFVDNREVDASSIRVETLNGTVMLSGFAKSENERSTAESIARKVNGVKSVKNEIAVRP